MSLVGVERQRVQLIIPDPLTLDYIVLNIDTIVRIDGSSDLNIEQGVTNVGSTM